MTDTKRRLAIVEDWNDEYAQGVNDIEDVRCDRCSYWHGADADYCAAGVRFPATDQNPDGLSLPGWGCASFKAKEET